LKDCRTLRLGQRMLNRRLT